MYFHDFFNACLTNAFTFPSLWTSSLRTTLKPPKTLGGPLVSGLFQERGQNGASLFHVSAWAGCGTAASPLPSPSMWLPLPPENSWFYSGLEI